MAKKTPSRSIYQIKVTLMDSKPPIWRRLLIADSMALSALHEVLQIAMGWTNSHMHQFIAGREYFGTPDPELDFEVTDSRRVRIGELMMDEKDSIIYEYDFGDGWRHKIVLEKVLPFDPKAALPLCVTGKRACPPEDIGGVWGYENFLEAIQDPKHPEHEECLEWVGGEFDPALFDADEVNALFYDYL